MKIRDDGPNVDASSMAALREGARGSRRLGIGSDPEGRAFAVWVLLLAALLILCIYWLQVSEPAVSRTLESVPAARME